MPKRDYLHGVMAASARAGELNSDAAAMLVEFVHRSTLFLDSTNPDEKYLEHATVDEKRSHAAETATNLERLLALGDELSQIA
jgi:hypothetical protein